MSYQSIGAIDYRAVKLEWQHKIYMKFSCYKKTAVFLIRLRDTNDCM